MSSVASSSEPSGPATPAVSADSGWVEKYLEHVRVERRLAARTVELYAFHLKSLTDHAAEAKLPLDRVQTAHIRRWMAQLHGAGREPRGIALVLSCWRSFYRWLGHEGLVGFNPVQDVHAPKAGKPLPKALGVDDAVRLAELYDPEADPWTEARDSAIVEMLYGCGLRVSELTGLDAQASSTARGWVDLDAGDANVLGKGSKRRLVPVGSKALEALAAWLAVRGDCAALEAARLRYRPIIMTSRAFIFGVLPLAISTGAGAGSRHSIGTGVVGGMLTATFLAVFFVPLFYLWTRRLSRRSLRK